jgi:four helix bundle protein
MTTIKRFEDLECWQEARKFVKLIYKLTKNDRFRKDFELVGQITDSAISTMSNIAEGFHRNSNKEFMRFLDYSRASVAETLSHSYVALDQEYISESEMAEVKESGEIVWKKVNNFISYLSQSSKSRKSLPKHPITIKTNRTNKTNETN